MSNREIKVSANAVLGLLAGVITQAQFSHMLGLSAQPGEMPGIQTPFSYMLKRKMKIKEIIIEDTAHDDSNLVFRFDGPDPALSRFVNPKEP